jgi:hypothetical protein
MNSKSAHALLPPWIIRENADGMQGLQAGSLLTFFARVPASVLTEAIVGLGRF